MRVLIDTNIIIAREDMRALPEDVQGLLKVLSNLGVTLTVHPASIQDIQQDKDEERKRVLLSKVDAYILLEPPRRGKEDTFFYKAVGPPKTRNDIVDNDLLFSVYKRAVSYLQSPIQLKTLLELGLLSGPPQSITEVDNDIFQQISDLGGIDERIIIR
ncbi:MAG: hypothetical protein KKB90_00145 [Actinobacteria bacterium]|nr:hypothetical protein [Actinomycetota bacterium]MCG2818045.1 hypothetical protein [Actinomycetes bacterium]MBU4217359.1 hypothetical protein [Actinomycetota bacterium]MBU4359633.1 hypothetical protein [Actinomycetota bacterium]MBU4392196.1 hypothetical protein [Actinomycetota bacterium]